jgi:hypothetical protein
MQSKAWLILAVISFISACGGGANGGSDSQSSQANRPPVLTVESVSRVEGGEAGVLIASARDPDGDALSFALTGLDADSFFMPSPGVIAFKEVPDYEQPRDQDLDNIYELTVVVADYSLEVSSDITVEVLNALEGRVVDAPLDGSTIFVDLNANGSLDDGEAVVKSFSFPYLKI